MLDVRDDPELDKNQIGRVLFQQYISPNKGLPRSSACFDKTRFMKTKQASLVVY